MKYITPEISWHNRDPLYSIDIQPHFDDIQRLASCGTDKNIRIWSISQNEKGSACVSYISTLSRHSKTVNVVRFSPNGKILASGGDDSFVILWQMSVQQSTAPSFDEEDDNPSENWSVVKCLRSHLEDVYDLSWSADGDLLLSGSVDNVAILWDVKKGLKLHMFNAHKSYVQGVALDPLNQFIVTFSCDRSMKVFQMLDYKLLHDVKKLSMGAGKEFRMFHDDSMKSFFRRLSFSPDGQLLVVPSGCFESNSNLNDNQTNAIINTTYLFSRNDLSKPILTLPVPSFCKATLAARFCPVFFRLRDVKKNIDASTSMEEKCESILKLPYRLVFAVATENSVLLYDTQQPTPIVFITNIHYDILSDLTWSSDGKLLVASSIDGYCTLITFNEGELGDQMECGPIDTLPTSAHAYDSTSEKIQGLQISNDKTEKLSQLPSSLNMPPSAEQSLNLPLVELNVLHTNVPSTSVNIPSTSELPSSPSIVSPTSKVPSSNVQTSLVKSNTLIDTSEVRKPRRITVTTLLS